MLNRRGKWSLSGIYLVTSPKRPPAQLVSIVEAALEGEVSLVQFRDKGQYSEEERVPTIGALKDLCHRYKVPLLVNDDPQLARRVAADGVHVGREDPSPRIARALLGPEALVGVTVYGKPGEEKTAEAGGADYLGVGPFFPSLTKPDEPELPLHVLDAVVHRSHLPVFAIGGINAERAGLLARHGVAGLAAVSAIMDAPDPQRAAVELRDAFLAGKQRGSATSVRT
jgi:thiamine-phosphate diphosphorylase